MGNQAPQNATNPKMLDFGSPSSGTQGNELTFGMTDKAHTGLLIINYAILNSFFFFTFQHFSTHRTLETLGWKEKSFWHN